MMEELAEPSAGSTPQRRALAALFGAGAAAAAAGAAAASAAAAKTPRRAKTPSVVITDESTVLVKIKSKTPPYLLPSFLPFFLSFFLPLLTSFFLT